MRIHYKTRGPRACYRPKAPPGKSVSLTAFAKQILTAAAQRASQSESEIVEHLLRLHGGAVRRVDFKPLNENGEHA